MRVPSNKVLFELAAFALESDSEGRKYDYTDEDFLNTLIIFNSAAGTKLFDLCKKEDVDFKIMTEQAQKFGEELRLLIYTYLDIDTHELARK